MKVQVEVSENRIISALVQAWESNIADCWLASADQPYRIDAQDRRTLHLPIAVKDRHTGRRYTLTLAKVQRGLRVMSQRYPFHFVTVLQGEIDDLTGDLFAQCCVLGEIVYG